MSATGETVTLTVEGVRVESEANAHAHWRTRQRRAQMQRGIVRAALVGIDKAPYLAAPRLRVTFARIVGPRGRAFDSDNLVGAMKHCRDEVAAWLGRDDGDRWYDWRYDCDQPRGKDFGIRITLSPLPAAGAAEG